MEVKLTIVWHINIVTVNEPYITAKTDDFNKCVLKENNS
jgi:hypothetical protein